MEKLYADPTGENAHLDRYAASEALKGAETDAKSTHDRGLVITGKVSLSGANVTKVDVSGQVPNATVSACLDISRWVTASAKSRESVSLPETRLTSYEIVSVVEKYPEGWRVTRDEPQGKAC
ncbi:secreted protein/lipoprotein [Streptomyces rubrogriseus]|uniref:Secreted protein/lipoprotein n=2 Tax=Streptomyces rubrogriseus TaxID=194673 RepID=A0A6G3TGB8_9ACTN|nr:secreted protein/lipoprotein [Streptomyces rubrogriseus]NEC35495.1 secreted protein/lipoprotein [Streptomyces rubrogriseus]